MQPGVQLLLWRMTEAEGGGMAAVQGCGLRALGPCRVRLRVGRGARCGGVLRVKSSGEGGSCGPVQSAEETAQAELFRIAHEASLKANTPDRPCRRGDVVRVHYMGGLDDGTVFDTTRPFGQPEFAPLVVQLGAGALAPGFERLVEGMRIGEERRGRVEPEDGYGPVKEDLLVLLDPAQTEGLGLGVGDMLKMSNGKQYPVHSVGDDGAVTVSLNHPLAGKALTFLVELVSFREPAPEEALPGAPPA